MWLSNTLSLNKVANKNIWPVSIDITSIASYRLHILIQCMDILLHGLDILFCCFWTICLVSKQCKEISGQGYLYSMTSQSFLIFSYNYGIPRQHYMISTHDIQAILRIFAQPVRCLANGNWHSQVIQTIQVMSSQHKGYPDNTAWYLGNATEYLDNLPDV